MNKSANKPLNKSTNKPSWTAWKSMSTLTVLKQELESISYEESSCALTHTEGLNVPHSVVNYLAKRIAQMEGEENE